MTTDVEETQPDVHAQFFRELDACAGALRAFNPDLVVVFGPDHFNGFFYELMPAFCIGTAAEAGTDWRLESGALRVPHEVARLQIADAVHRQFVRHASHEGRSRHHHTAVQADRVARALR